MAPMALFKLKIKLKNSRSSALDESGNAFIELALVLPFFVLLGLAGIESSQTISGKQVATQMSREFAMISFRECAAEIVNVPPDIFDPAACLDRARTMFENESAAVAGNFEAIVSLYNWEGMAAALKASSATNAGVNSNFSTASFTNDSHLYRLLRNYRVVVIAEVTVTLGEVPGTVPTFGLFNSGDVNAATIM